MEEIDRLKKIFEEHQSCYSDRAGEMVMTFGDFKLAFAELRALSLFNVRQRLLDAYEKGVSDGESGSYNPENVA